MDLIDFKKDIGTDHEEQLNNDLINMYRDETQFFIFVQQSNYTHIDNPANELHLYAEDKALETIKLRANLTPSCSFLHYFKNVYDYVTYFYLCSYLIVSRHNTDSFILRIGAAVPTIDVNNIDWREKSFVIRDMKNPLGEIQKVFKDQAESSRHTFINTVNVLTKIKEIF